VRVTDVPLAKAAEQVPPLVVQLIPAGELEIASAPEVARLTKILKGPAEDPPDKIS
jgi:hypothetical protein